MKIALCRRKKYLNDLNKVLISILVILINFGCKEKIDIDGHWHIYRNDEFSYEFGTIDINDSISTWDKERFDDWYKALIIAEKNIIILPPSEIYTEYQYQLKGDTLLLNEIGGNDHLFGIKRQKDECDLEADYFATYMTSINLPIIEQPSINNQSENGFNQIFLVGRPKKPFKERYGDTVRIEFYSGYVGLDELELMNKRHEVKVPDNKKKDINILIYADENVLMEQLLNVIKKLKSINNWDIYLAGKRTKKAKQRSEFTYQPIYTDVEFNEGESIVEWLSREK